MAAALLAGSFPVAAQFCPQDGEGFYRSREVKSARLDKTFMDVYKINQEYYYQLKVDVTGWSTATKGETYVLSAERDYSTGKIYS